MGDGLKRAFAAAKATRKRPRALERRLAWYAEMRQYPSGAFSAVRLRNPLNNSHRDWHGPWRERKTARTAVEMACLAAKLPTGTPCIVTLTRYGVGVMDDDNLRAALKPARDAVATDYIGIKDNDPRIEWVYRQAKAPKGCFGVRIEIASADSAPCGAAARA
jgi:hypothetical protein